MEVKSYKDFGRAKYQLKSVGNDLSIDFIEKVSAVSARAVALSDIYKSVEGLDSADDIKSVLLNMISDTDKVVVELSEESVSKGLSTYKVRGLTPKERAFLFNIMPIDKIPSPPKKRRNPTSLDSRVSDDELWYYDEDDPTYKQELILYSKMASDAGLTMATFKLMCCVDGFDLTDEEIQQELGEPAKATRDRSAYLNGLKDPKEYIERVKQVERILMNSIDTRHLEFLISCIDDMTGVKSENINFM